MHSILIHLTTHVVHVLGVNKELKLNVYYGRSFDRHMNQLNLHKTERKGGSDSHLVMVVHAGELPPTAVTSDLDQTLVRQRVRWK